MGKQVRVLHQVEQYKGRHVLEIKEYNSFGARQSGFLFMLIKTIRRKYGYEAIPFIRRISGGKEGFIAFPLVILSKIGLLPKGKKNSYHRLQKLDQSSCCFKTTGTCQTW